MVSMGHGSSSSHASPPSTAVNGVVNHNPSPGREESISVGEVETPPTLRSSSAKSRRSTTSLTLLFRKRRWKKHRGSISASFSINENDIKVELLNVNTATEEELMTLPGINRSLARNIINHRQLIGGFRKVEDLALVSGMGATKLDHIRPEICITRKKAVNLSRASSKTPSIESIPSLADSSRMTPRWHRATNINNATIFDLMSVNGVNQALAAKIITYRDRKGPFKNVDDLKNVGISYKRLGAIRMYLTTEEWDSDKGSTKSTNSPCQIRTPKLNKGHSRSSSVPVAKPDLSFDINNQKMNGVGSSPSTQPQSQDLKVIYELMSVKTKRPNRLSDFQFTHKCLPAYRIATWNLERLTLEKIANPGVLEVITRTILENGFSIVAVQEICDITALEKICKELNEPTLLKNREWRGHRGIWKCALNESPVHYKKTAYHHGIMYNLEQIDEVRITDSNVVSPFQNGSLWQFAVFRVKTKNSSWILVNVLSTSLDSGVYTNGHAHNSEKKEDIVESIQELANETDGIIIMGYFNAQQAQKGIGNIENIIRISPNPNKDIEIEIAAPNNLWLTSGLSHIVTGDSGTVDEGLSHLAIPNGWSWGGKATNTGPTWCTLYDMPKTTTIIDSDTEEDNVILNENSVPESPKIISS